MRESSFELISRPDISLRRAVSRFLSGVGFVGLSASTIALVLLPPPNAQPNFRWVVIWTFLGTLTSAALFVVTRRKGLRGTRIARFHDTAVLFTTLFCHLAISQNIYYREGSQTLLAALLLNLWACSLVSSRIAVIILSAGFLAPLLADAQYVFSFGLHDIGELNGILMAVISIFPLGVSLSLDVATSSMRQNHARLLAAFEETRSALEEEIDDRSAALLRSQEQLFRAQHLRSVGTLAAGLAHELNNILTPARGFAEIIVSGSSPEQDQSYARRILDATIASTTITRALLTYTKQVPFRPEPTDLRDLVHQQIIPILSQLLPSNIKLRFECPSDIFLFVDPQMLQQSLTNLALNAVDAIEGDGTIEIVASLDSDIDPGSLPTEVHVDGGRIKAHPGPFARLEIRDTGTGIPSAEVDQVFDPFFTTKEHGTGLGLPTVQGIMERHGGTISLSTDPTGTCFTLMLPAVASRHGNLEGDTDSSPRGELRALLLTEDHDLIDELEAMLADLTFSTTVASAVPLAPPTGSDAPYDVIFVDMDMDSRKPLDPQICDVTLTVLLSTAPIRESYLRAHGGTFDVGLRKPVDATHVRSTVSRLLSLYP